MTYSSMLNIHELSTSFCAEKVGMPRSDSLFTSSRHADRSPPEMDRGRNRYRLSTNGIPGLVDTGGDDLQAAQHGREVVAERLVWAVVREVADLDFVRSARGRNDGVN